MRNGSIVNQADVYAMLAFYPRNETGIDDSIKPPAPAFEALISLVHGAEVSLSAPITRG